MAIDPAESESESESEISGGDMPNYEEDPDAFDVDEYLEEMANHFIDEHSDLIQTFIEDTNNQQLFTEILKFTDSKKGTKMDPEDKYTADTIIEEDLAEQILHRLFAFVINGSYN